jgi:hypothetical protein
MTSSMINWFAVVLCSALLLPLTGSAGQQAAAAPVSNEDAPGGQIGSIKINGHWTITVTNPDRSVASRHQFNNALTATGLNFSRDSSGTTQATPSGGGKSIWDPARELTPAPIRQACAWGASSGRSGMPGRFLFTRRISLSEPPVRRLSFREASRRRSPVPLMTSRRRSGVVAVTSDNSRGTPFQRPLRFRPDRRLT